MKLPMTLPLLPGLRWEGKLTIRSKQNGYYLAAFDATAPKAHPNERYVMDQHYLNPQQLKDWTGFSEKE